MKSDKEIKKEFRKKASSNPDKYYATKKLKEMGYSRSKCNSCGLYFWSTDSSREVCGDANCSGGFDLNKRNVKSIEYTDIWKKFSNQFEDLGYKSIPRYPVVSRWNPTTDFTMASIAAFQPYVVSGEIKPPAKELTIPQFSLRFNDIDNVGRTGSHFTGFVMIGQHAFVPKEEWNQEKYFSDINKWLNDGLKLNKDDITFHEDVWAGGGNFGACMEYFSGGIELGNQVYMQYEQTQSGYKELNQKVLDMGMGQERCAWFTQPEKTSYDTTFPTVVDHIFTQSGIKRKTDIMKKFKPYASYLNDDETDNLDREWEKISKKINIDKDVLKSTVSKTSALYSIADHSRSLLVAINDGALPSNVGGGYNLRIILRRALDFINEYDYDIDFNKLMELHANYLKPQYPELSENLESIQEIIKEENSKYKKTKKKTKKKIKKLTKTKEKFSYSELKKLYQSDGISPEDIKKVNTDVKLEEGFYSKLSSEESSINQLNKDENQFLKEFDGFENLPKTKRLYYDDYTKLEFKTNLIKSYTHKNKSYLVFDKTYFYPTSGGQQSDKGYIIIDNKKIEIDSVIKFEDVVFHVTNETIDKKRLEISCKINKKRRYQLTKHHTGAHIINYAAHKYLGSHVWQAGAHKTINKGRLDITHYKSLSLYDELEIERNANDLIKKDIKVEKFFEDKDKAEKKYGMRVYQGGAIPGSKLRIIKIGNYDVEACGGTHLNRTSEAEFIRVINSTRIQDGVVRIEYVAGSKAKEYDNLNVKIFNKLNQIYNDYSNQNLEDYNSLEELNFHIKKSKKLLNISRPKLIDKVKEFSNEMKQVSKDLKKLSSEYDIELNLPSYESNLNFYDFIEETFSLWKKYKSLQESYEEKVIKNIDKKFGKINISSNSLRKLANRFYPENFLIYNKDGFFVINDEKIEKKLKDNNVGFGGRDFKQGKAEIDLLKKLL